MFNVDSLPCTGGAFLTGGALAFVAGFATIYPPVGQRIEHDANNDSRVYSSPQTATAPHINKALTNSTYLAVDFSVGTERSAVGEGMDWSILSDEQWIRELDRSAAWKAAMDELSEVANFSDGWQGPQSSEASPVTITTAVALLGVLEELVDDDAAPMVSLDDDGYVILSWSDGSLQGSLSVYDDETFTYFIKRGDAIASGSNRTVNDLAAEKIISVLTA